MPNIVVLPTALKNKIAAGEVVERPASVVRELLENAIDAHAAEITVEVEQGGRKLIRVMDDGDGMDRDDALLCLERHATSKLKDEEALFAIATMGFRGEALPSIASVSRMNLTTAPRGESLGVFVELEGGDIREEREAPARGTDVQVRDLFFNTPARRKFLKRDATELGHVVDTVTSLALTHPDIRFRLYVGAQETINLPQASGLRERLVQVYGTEFADELLEARIETEGFALQAFCSRPGHFRDRRSNQFIFINRRPVKVPAVHHALMSAYEGVLPRDKHPVYFIHLDIDPRLVDFNVHPAKREVRFSDREGIYRFVRRSIADALIIHTEGDAAQSFPHATSPFSEGQVHPAQTGGEPVSTVPGSAAPDGVPFHVPHGISTGHAVSESQPLQYRTERPFIYLGDTFVALAGEPGKEGLTLLDHHAAHERVLFERLMGGLRLQSKRLLFPRQVELSPAEHLALIESRELLFDFGIELDDFGGTTVVVRAVPEEMDQADLRGILSDAAHELRKGERPGQPLQEAVAARLACHSSIRGSRVLTREGLDALLADLEQCQDPLHCPHGRPTVVQFSLEELKKLFKRT